MGAGSLREHKGSDCAQTNTQTTNTLYKKEEGGEDKRNTLIYNGGPNNLLLYGIGRGESLEKCYKTMGQGVK